MIVGCKGEIFIWELMDDKIGKIKKDRLSNDLIVGYIIIVDQ